ncbi:MAG: GGDEF domain-containing protein [Solobacterium sp.]|nr:GGDEF domain-containing protein [Solobacterium sp.]
MPKTVRDIERIANVKDGIESGLENSGNERIPEGHNAQDSMTYSSIAHALAHRYDSIYYVDLRNDHYVEYTSSSEYQDLKIETGGDDFFADSARNIRRVVHPDDLDFALMVHNKEYILSELEKDSLVSFTYRLMFDGVPHYYNGRITKGGPEDPNHLIIGWANVDKEIQREKEFEAAKNENHMTRNIGNALLSDFVRVFYVDLQEDTFMEFEPDEISSELTVTRNGDHFFNEIQEIARAHVYRADLERVSAAMDKELMMDLMIDAPFTITYRSTEHGTPEWYSIKALYADNQTHMLLAIRNIDIQKRREAEYEDRLHSMSVLANQDAMTKVKNHNAFAQEESMWDQIITGGESVSKFAIAVFDVNDLKVTNDTYGHKAGDQLIIDAAKMICTTFKHSPVFRIGGDEFAVVMTNSDYENRNQLFSSIKEAAISNAEHGNVVIASGLAVYDPTIDQTFSDVFTRADTQMYSDKRILKNEEDPDKAL